MKLTLGPLLFHWPALKRKDFYAAIADEAPIDTVYLGEVVCSKRAPFFADEMEEVAEKLKRAGKTVIYSTLAEVVSPHDQALVERVCARAEDVEINDITALALRGKRSHRLGQYMNVYNEDTLAFLAARGATHVCLPAELHADAIKVLATKARDLIGEKRDVGVEVQVFGRAPLALSSRCYHARAYERTKDTCQFVCAQAEDEMALQTLDGTEFLTINGVQVLSHGFLNLAGSLEDLIAMGVGYARLSPHACDMVAVAKAFAGVIQGCLSAPNANEALRTAGVVAPFSNGFFYHRAGHAWVA